MLFVWLVCEVGCCFDEMLRDRVGVGFGCSRNMHWCCGLVVGCAVELGADLALRCGDAVVIVIWLE